MRAAVQEMNEGKACEMNEGSRDLPISLGRSWQKRGHTYLNGIVSAASMDTGKIIDVEIFSKFCKCKHKSANKHDGNCMTDFQGTSGAMEVAGAEAIFGCSLATYNQGKMLFLQCSLISP